MQTSEQASRQTGKALSAPNWAIHLLNLLLQWPVIRFHVLLPRQSWAITLNLQKPICFPGRVLH